MADPTRRCLAPGCEAFARTRGWCPKHYVRWRRSDQFEPVALPTDMERWEAKVDRNGPVPKHRPDLGPCWLWTAAHCGNGYGLFRCDGTLQIAHKWAWEAEHGPVPDGKELDHFACDRRICCNPAHVRPVTHQENMARGLYASRTHCPQGHPYDLANTCITARGTRSCRACKREKARERRARGAAQP